MAGERGKKHWLLKVNTGTIAVPVWTPLEEVALGASKDFSRDKIETTTLNNITNIKTYIAGDSDFSIKGTFNIVEDAPGQAVVVKAAHPGGDGVIGVQWANRVGTGQPLYTAQMIVTAATETNQDPFTFDFEFALQDEPEETTQS